LGNERPLDAREGGLGLLGDVEDDGGAELVVAVAPHDERVGRKRQVPDRRQRADEEQRRRGRGAGVGRPEKEAFDK
jgi:hypothetical protein